MPGVHVARRPLRYEDPRGQNCQDIEGGCSEIEDRPVGASVTALNVSAAEYCSDMCLALVKIRNTRHNTRHNTYWVMLREYLCTDIWVKRTRMDIMQKSVTFFSTSELRYTNLKTVQIKNKTMWCAILSIRATIC